MARPLASVAEIIGSLVGLCVLVGCGVQATRWLRAPRRLAREAGSAPAPTAPGLPVPAALVSRWITYVGSHVSGVEDGGPSVGCQVVAHGAHGAAWVGEPLFGHR